VALGVASLVLPSVPTYDPWAWLIWGRELAHGELSTTGGPSWKPLPIAVTAPASLLGDAVAPPVWLVVARAGALLAVAAAHRVAAHVAGRPAGAVAAVALVLSEGFVFHAARGNSEGLLIALCLCAVECHLAGRRTTAFGLGVAAALLRPEVWPVLAVYAVLLLHRERDRRTVVLVAAAAVAVPALWFGPEYAGSGHATRAVTRALQPNLDAATFAPHPFVAVFERSAPLLSLPVYVGAAAAVVFAVHRRDRLVLALAAGATGLMVLVAVMTEAGFAGNLRYVALPAALVCVVAGVGWAGLADRARRPGLAGAALATTLTVLLVVPAVHDDLRALQRDARAIGDEAALDGSLDDVIRAAGGEAAVLACGPVVTGAFQTQVLAWHLDVPQDLIEVDPTPRPPGTVIAPRTTAMSRDRDFAVVARNDRWTVRSSCR
jgi:hypothetical protein